MTDIKAPRAPVAEATVRVGVDISDEIDNDLTSAVTGLGKDVAGLGSAGDQADPEMDLLIGQLSALTSMLLDVRTVNEVLEVIVQAAMWMVPGGDLVSVTLRAPDGVYFTPVETDEIATELDQVQYTTGEGPCLDAARIDGTGMVGSDDLRLEARWPRFTAAAAEHGLGAIISTELALADESPRFTGALNIYSRNENGLTTTDRHAALLLATHASLALAHAHTSEVADLRQISLQRAIDSRDVIGQAKGILMNRQGLTAEEAFDVLRRTSQDLNVRVADLARTLTTRHGDLDQK